MGNFGIGSTRNVCFPMGKHDPRVEAYRATLLTPEDRDLMRRSLEADPAVYARIAGEEISKIDWVYDPDGDEDPCLVYARLEVQALRNTTKRILVEAPWQGW